MCFDSTSKALSFTSNTTPTLPAPPPMPNRHELRNAVRQFARVQKKAGDFGPFYVTDLTSDLAKKVAPASHPNFSQIKDKIQKLLEQSVIFSHDTHCGEIRVTVRSDAKL